MWKLARKLFIGKENTACDVMFLLENMTI